MVAYSFAPMFAPQVEAKVKNHTLRGDRARHARVGEPVQLYAGMRTRQCRKLVAIDPICVEVAPATLFIDPGFSRLLAWAEIDGVRLNAMETERFAVSDGFGGQDRSARLAMGEWWLDKHGEGCGDPFLWGGVLIRWEHGA